LERNRWLTAGCETKPPPSASKQQRYLAIQYTKHESIRPKTEGTEFVDTCPRAAVHLSGRCLRDDSGCSRPSTRGHPPPGLRALRHRTSRRAGSLSARHVASRRAGSIRCRDVCRTVGGSDPFHVCPLHQAPACWSCSRLEHSQKPH
jgi:hypothetical protein